MNLLRDLGYSLRRLRKNPALTLVVLLTLALGIGAITAMFTIDYAIMIAPLPYPNPTNSWWSGPSLTEPQRYCSG